MDTELKVKTVGNPEVLSFRLPSPPPSVNSMYQINFSRKQTYMKPEVRTYKTMMKLYVPKFNVGETDKVSISVRVHQDWFHKCGSFKKQDCQNMQKVLVDLISEKQGWEDQQVWEFSIKKVQDKNSSFVEVEESIL
ncbi:RusA family crossover junction endodeoxyribonuclease [Patescibacteria group bacterium]|nr:RusA family crossover junction endodeoxyribonuclease [Patescibacteria group bacterium]